MKIKAIMRNLSRARRFLLASLLSVSLLGSCGGVVESLVVSGIGGTGIVYGEITGFGSVFVNGREFNTDSSNFLVDGAIADQDALRQGMVITLKVETSNGMYTGKAFDVVYDDEVEGPLENVMLDLTNPARKTATIFGQTITVDQGTTIFENTNFNDFGDMETGLNDVVEISGFRTSATEIIATYVRFIDDLIPGVTEVELRGPIVNLLGTAPNESFEVDGINITRQPSTHLDVPNDTLVETLFVEVKGVIQNDLSVLADEIEFEDDDFGSDVDDVSLQGIISNFIDITNFEIEGQLINAFDAELSPASLAVLLANPLTANGLEVEVEGDIDGLGILIADKLEIPEEETRLRAFVSQVDVASNWFEVTYPVTTGPVSVRINTTGQTVFEDQAGVNPLQNMSINNLVVTPVMDFVRIEGREVNGEVVASVVKRRDADDFRLKGAVDSFMPLQSITVLGITYQVDTTPITGTVFDGFPNAAAFFSALDAALDPVVKIEDDQPADGIADKVELD